MNRSRRWWAYYDIEDPQTMILLSHRKITNKEVGRMFRELPRAINSKGIVPFVVGQNHLSKDQMDEITGSKGGIIE